MDEIWKPIIGTDYAVSNTGKIASMKKGWRVLRPRRDRNGYLGVALCDGAGGKRPARVHTLVAEAFLAQRPTPAHEVNHKNGVKADNYAGNLEWMTKSENVLHTYKALGRKAKIVRGKANGQTELTEIEVREIRRRRAAGELLTAIAADYGIAQSTVCMIAHRKNWGWLT